MFQYGRYDPREEDRQQQQRNNKDKKRLRSSSKPKKSKRNGKKVEDAGNDNNNDDHEIITPETTLRVIAPETDGATSSQRKLDTKLTEEAFDDLDLTTTTTTEDLLVVEEKNEDPSEQQQQQQQDETSLDPTDELQRALYLSKQTIDYAAKRWGLASFLVDNLQADGYTSFFPIQALVIPDVIAAERHSQMRARDVCVAAPTGSGKTLAFVLPVLNALANRKIRRLRALVVLPSRDLGTFIYIYVCLCVEGESIHPPR
jgi:hypothetical protein